MDTNKPSRPQEKSATKASTDKGNNDAVSEQVDKKAVLVVVGPKEGRRRAGYNFTSERTIIDLASLTEAQVVAITADPRLVVSEARL